MMEQNNILQQRQIEARLMKRVIEGLFEKFDKDEVLSNLRDTFRKIAYEDGKKLKKEKSNPMLILEKHWQKLTEGEALVMEGFLNTESKMSFKVTQCKYAEFYKEIGAPELGTILSCCRDEAFLKGFTNRIKMMRSKTILEGNNCCEFKYELQSPEKFNKQKEY